MPQPTDNDRRAMLDPSLYQRRPMSWQAKLGCRLGGRLSDWLDARSDHDRRVDAPLWWRALDRLAGWLYTWGYGANCSQGERP